MVDHGTNRRVRKGDVSMRQNTLSFKTNNNGILNMIQHELDGKVIVKRLEKDKGYKTITTIPAGDMVMLANMYKYIKENNIQNAFINPNGKIIERAISI